ncbi:Plasmodium exported protein, unknown function [Plasmodium vivax]|nr:Plasmodium exported protein, unknown function [Plasmodium vivax]
MKCTLVKSLECGSKIDICFGRNTNRILATHRDESESQRIRLQNKSNDNVYKHKLSYGNESSNIYGHLKQDKLNNVDTYLKSYKSRYAKKKGLKKFDCYYEKKLFSSINKLEKHMKKNNLSKNRIKGVIFLKYGLPFILLSLLPILSRAVPYRQIIRTYKIKLPDGYTITKGTHTSTVIRTRNLTYDASLRCIYL